MRGRTLGALALCGSVAALGAVPSGCNSDGELVVIVRSEIAIDGVAYEILRDGALIERRCTLLSETSSGGLPGSISVTGAAGTSVTLRIVGLVGSTCDQSAGFDPSQLGDLAVLREIVTTVPEGRSATLNVLFKKSCGRTDGVIVADGVGEFDDTACGDGTTCIDAPDGSCESSVVDSSSLDDYSNGDLGGGGSGVIGGNGAGAGGNGGAGAGGDGGAGGGGGPPGQCQVTNVATGVRSVTALPAQIDAVYFTNDSDILRWESGSTKTVPFAGTSAMVFDLAAAVAAPNEVLVIGDATNAPTVKTVSFDGTNFAAGLQQGLGVTNVAAAALTGGIAPLWTEDDPMGEAAHWVKPLGLTMPLVSSLGAGQLIEAAGNFAAVAYTTETSMSKLDIVDLGSCTSFCPPVDTIDTGVTSLAVGSGAVAWIDDTGALQRFSLSNKTVTALGSGHKLIAASMDGPTAVIDMANVLRLRTNGFDGPESCSINVGIPVQLVQTKDAAYVLLDAGHALRRYSIAP